MLGKPVAIIGYSGHGFVVADAALNAGINLQYYAEQTPGKANPFNLEYLGFESDEKFAGWQHDIEYMLGIGDNNIRRRVAEKVLLQGKELVNVIDPSASISGRVVIGRGVFISRNVSLNVLASVGDFSILNTACIIEHECQIGTAVHIAPGAVLAGNVKVGNNSFVGANAVVKQGVKIGNNVVVGAGCVVLNDIPDGKIMIGNPGRYYEK